MREKGRLLLVSGPYIDRALLERVFGEEYDIRTAEAEQVRKLLMTRKEGYSAMLLDCCEAEEQRMDLLRTILREPPLAELPVLVAVPDAASAARVLPVSYTHLGPLPAPGQRRRWKGHPPPGPPPERRGGAQRRRSQRPPPSWEPAGPGRCGLLHRYGWIPGSMPPPSPLRPPGVWGRGRSPPPPQPAAAPHSWYRR